MPNKIKAAVFCDGASWIPGAHVFDQVFADGRQETLADITDLYPERITSANFDAHAGNLGGLEVIFSTWVMPELTLEQIKSMPNLKAVFYAAGATGGFRKPFEESGVIVCSATAANAVAVAEFALAQILLAGAGYWRNSRECRCPETTSMEKSYRGRGNFGGRVAILGDGSVSLHLQKLLAHHDLEAAVVSSWADKRTLSLEEAFSTSFVIANMLPDLGSDNAEMLDGGLFRRMPDSAVFINVGRGQQVNESELIAVMKERPDLTALLDVAWPEPPAAGSELYTLPNIRLSGHIAGAKSGELPRLADCMIEEFLRFERGEPLLRQVQADQL